MLHRKSTETHNIRDATRQRATTVQLSVRFPDVSVGNVPSSSFVEAPCCGFRSCPFSDVKTLS